MFTDTSQCLCPWPRDSSVFTGFCPSTSCSPWLTTSSRASSRSQRTCLARSTPTLPSSEKHRHLWADVRWGSVRCGDPSGTVSHYHTLCQRPRPNTANVSRDLHNYIRHWSQDEPEANKFIIPHHLCDMSRGIFCACFADGTSRKRFVDSFRGQNGLFFMHVLYISVSLIAWRNILELFWLHQQYTVIKSAVASSKQARSAAPLKK